jgi:hypothetical protein
MQPLSRYVAACLTQRLLVNSPIRDVYWTPSIAQKLGRGGGSPPPLLGLGDFFVGTYESLRNAKATARMLAKGMWAGSEIHHIVENYHLQFLGVVQPIDDQTYGYREPCVLLGKKHHDTHVDSIVGGAEQVVLETKPFDFLEAFRAANPGISHLSRTDQGRRRANWVRAEERARPPRVTRYQIRDWLVEMYRFAYQEPELRPLRLIATAVLRGMPL